MYKDYLKNVINDEQNYYFFRALNMEDNNDLKLGKITDENGKIIRIRTDRQRWVENKENPEPKYDENDPLTIEQICDHIKENYRRDTNCISLSYSPTVSLRYGKGYTQKYVMIIIPKEEIGKTVVNAEKYILENAKEKSEDILEIVKRAKDSNEFIHYGEIEESKIVSVPKEVMQVLGIIKKE